MMVHELLNQLIYGDLARSVQIFCPELIVCASIVLMLLVRVFGAERAVPSCWVALLGSLLAFTAAFAQFMFIKTGSVDGGVFGALYEVFRLTEAGVGAEGPLFTGLLMHDHFTLFVRLGLLLFLVLVIALTVLSGLPDNEDGQDFYTLLLGSMVGMLLATASNHLLMIFISVEMISVPSYVMVAFLKGQRKSSEAALKYVVYGAGAAGVMLYGVSLLAGLLGSADMGEIAYRLPHILEGEGVVTVATVVLAVMMVFVGLAFKLSLVPFHFWCPDAFQGASAEVAGFLSVAPKAAVFALLVRFLVAFQGNSEVLQSLSLYFGIALGVVAAVSTTFGNLAAFTQSNVKRMLAYSTIAHAGYMLMAVSALLVLSAGRGSFPGDVHQESLRAVEGLMYYLGVYLFMNLTAFAIVALIRNEIYSEEIEDYNGLVMYNPAAKFLCVCMGIALFSLVGLPPFGGFFAKMMVFMSVYKAGYVHWVMWVLLAIGGLNTVFSLFYYLRVLKAMFLNPRPDGARPLRTPAIVGMYVALITLPILLLGASPLQDDLSRTARYVAASLFR